VRDPKKEYWLKHTMQLSEGTHWNYLEEVPLSEFDIDTSLANQARLGAPLNQEAVLKYACDMLDGAAFPAIIAYRKNAKLVIIGGNTRLHAAIEAKRKTIDCYVVTITDPLTLHLLTVRDNTIEGRPQTKEENLEHAKSLVASGAFSVNEAAKMFGLGYQTLARSIRIQSVKTTLLLKGVELDASDEILAMLNKLASDEDIMVSVAWLIRSSKMDHATAKTFVNEVHRIHSHDGRRRVIDDWSTRPSVQVATVRPGRPKKAPKTYGERAAESLVSLKTNLSSADISVLVKQIGDSEQMLADLQFCVQVVKAVSVMTQRGVA